MIKRPLASVVMNKTLARGTSSLGPGENRHRAGTGTSQAILSTFLAPIGKAQEMPRNSLNWKIDSEVRVWPQADARIDVYNRQYVFPARA